MKHTIHGYVTYTKHTYQMEAEISFTTYRPSSEYSPDTVVVCEHSIEVDVPDDFDPRPGMINALREKERIARAAFQATITDIHRQISELEAIEYTP